MTRDSLAAVQIGDRQFDYQRFPLPEIGPDEGLLQIDRCGICGADVQVFNGDVKENNFGYPTIPGHEPLGTIVQLGENAARRWGVAVGDRVILEATVPCGRCTFCVAGNTIACLDRKNLGYTRTTVAPSLWGGFAEYLYMAPNAVVHKLSRDVPLDVAATYNMLACGLGWTLDVAGVTAGDTVVVLGAGQRGLACVLAAKSTGAKQIIVSGLTKDRHKLEVAKRLGADVSVDVQEESVVDVVREVTNGDMANVVLDLAPDAPSTVLEALEMARPKATIVLAGLKGDRPVELLSDEIVRKALTLKGAWGKRSQSYKDAIQIMESGQYPLEMLHTRSYPLEDAADAIAALAGGGNEEAICVSLSPHGD